MLNAHDGLSRRTLGVAVLVLAGTLLASTSARARVDEFPTDREAAIAAYESDPDTWLDGPVQYLALPAEREAWDGLNTAGERAAFIERFWARRDDELRDGANPTRDAFYQRVAEANQRFAGFPRGWKSDPGRVWVILGRPDGIRGSAAGVTVWTYFTTGDHRAFTNAYGEMQLAFVQTGPGREEIVGDLAVGTFPFHVLQAFEHTRERMVVRDDGTLDGRG